ncbi:hypothetical protein GCM10007913_11820 [Devosia yakushimensis]|uniref:Uncharacterized protein n=1 Tax=Devosia yakushimensis TaxID=470028 RepID=A0ABQ5UDH1_9HYPH|nr:hypothetical protein [Devosia yakushimensis]GLQ09250.1 hypothetical protein GCM10007913_11820 [Devosia yakushimensis]
MRDLDELLPKVMPLAPSCPEPVALRYLRNAAREFCATTKLWREWDTVVLTAPEFQALPTIPDARIIEIEEGRIDGGPKIEPRTVLWLDDHYPGWADETEAGPARFITQIQPNTISVYPRQAGTLKARLVLQPSDTALEIPDFLIEDHGEALGRGAAGRILLLPSTEYTNPQLGAAYVAEWQGILDRWQTKARKGQQGARLRTKGSYL